MKILKIYVILIVAAISILSCANKQQDDAESLLQQANEYFDKKEYNKALRSIDSLRNIYPNAIEVRKQALKLYQSISLKQTQEDLARTDSALQAVILNYNYLKAKVDKDRQELRATPEELQMLTLVRMKRDSLQVCFDTQCAKIKYIHKKQKEI